MLFVTHAAYLDHVAGTYHPENPERLSAVARGVSDAHLDTGVELVEPAPATVEQISTVHPTAYLEHIEAMATAGGGRLDEDTFVSRGSWNAALFAAGAGLSAVTMLRAGGRDAAFCAVRPPGHHATRDRSMGFCFVNNVAVVATALADQGERVLIVDYDAHHGNGTQEIFYDDPRVLYVSFHQWPLYPGTGRPHEIGGARALGTTLNVALPPGATGDVYLAAFDTVVAPVAERFAPTWVLISAGFDAHRDDPITELGLTSADFPALTRRILSLAAPGHRLVMLEGGYDLEALRHSTAAVMRELIGADERPVEPVTNGGPGMERVRQIEQLWTEVGVLV